MRIFFFRRRWLTTLGCLCGAAVILWVVSNPGAIGAAARTRVLPVYRVAVPEGRKLAAITFDAAWDDVQMRHFRKVTEVPHFYLLMWQLNIATLIRFFTAVLLALAGQPQNMAIITPASSCFSNWKRNIYLPE